MRISDRCLLDRCLPETKQAGRTLTRRVFLETEFNGGNWQGREAKGLKTNQSLGRERERTIEQGFGA